MGTNFTRKKIRLYYLASGEIAIPLFSALLESPEIELVGCGTQPDRPKGRKRELEPTPVGKFSQDAGVITQKLESVNSSKFLAVLEGLNLDVILVFSFGQILKSPLLNLPRFGCLNVHTSLLPKYRGASPISAAILGGDKETGITIIRMEKGLDTGPIFAKFSLQISENTNTLELEKDLGQLARKKVCSILGPIVRGEITSNPQDSSNAIYTGKLCKDDGLISWSDEVGLNEKKVRAYYPWPGAWFVLNNTKSSLRIIITVAHVDGPETTELVEAGMIVSADRSGLAVACRQGVLKINRVLPEGKREMNVFDFLQGNPLKQGNKI